MIRCRLAFFSPLGGSYSSRAKVKGFQNDLNTLASKVIWITNKKEAQEKEKEARKEIRSKRENKKQEKNERSKREKRNAREKKRGCAYYENEK